MAKLIIFGTGPFAEIAHYYFSRQSAYNVVAFTVDAEYMDEATYCGLPVVPFSEVERQYPPQEHEVFVAVGLQKVNKQRECKVNEAESKHYRLASFISPKAAVADDLQVGANSMVMEHSILQPFVKVGRNSIIWSASRMGFHTTVGDHCWIVSAIFGERVLIGDNSFIGLNATIAPKVHIGKGNVIGAGALILSDTRDNEVYRERSSELSRVPSHRLRRV
jgi:sugar O-acyltransferase (sialic acid O-acetyltransferase NeuD family)